MDKTASTTINGPRAPSAHLPGTNPFAPARGPLGQLRALLTCPFCAPGVHGRTASG